jgi:hypothetical protein
MSAPDNEVIGYMCRIDFQCELGECPVTVYSSIESLKKKHPCWEQCGIMEVRVQGIRAVVPGSRA